MRTNLHPFLTVFCFVLGISGSAQDTLRVQTLTFDDITQRRGWFIFPDSTHQYRKVLMHHTLKCDPATTQDQYQCGEWDYLTYNMVHEHTGVMDSAALTHPLFKVGAVAPTSVESMALPSYHTWLLPVARRTITSTTNENVITVGQGGAMDTGLLQSVMGSSRSQYLFLADELSAAGLQAGPLQQLRFTTDAQGNGTYSRLTIRLKHTSATGLTAFDETGLQNVHEVAPGSLGTVAGEQTFVLTEPFNWDGTSNLLVDISAGRLNGTSAPAVEASNVGDGLALQAVGLDGYLQMKEDVVAADATPMAELSTAITVMFRAKGDAAISGQNTTILEALNAQGRRVLNVHLPWSNGRVYWDAGNTDGTYDRIDKAATTGDVQDQWNHWAFVKNTATGQMKIYLNGVLWHSGTGMTRPLTGISTFRLGSAANGSVPYPGALDEINVFGAEVDAATIFAWKDRAISAEHPNAGDLIYSFHCDELPDTHVLENSADPAHQALAMGTVQRRYREAPETFQNVQPMTVRPDLSFVQGSFESVLDTVVLERQEPLPLLTEEFFAVDGNGVVPVDTVFAWMGGMIYTYGPNGVPLDSIPAGGTIDINDTLHYFGVPFEVVRDWEIGRFITPYGIGLTLGPNGFRWTFDVTDYQWLLRDSVELSAGNQQELIDLEFELIEGVAPRRVVGHQRPWGGLMSRSYADLDNDVALPPVTVDLSTEASQWALRTRLTGHGHNSNTGAYPHCCEWKDNTHYLYLNGNQVDAWHIWQENDCAENPVYPQGGTWLNSREGWCPGDLVKDHEVLLPGLVAGGTATLDYGITPVPANNQGMGGGNYVINMDLMEYSAPSHQLDAEIVEVKRPSTTDMYRRDNPICYAPLIILRNAGSTDLTNVTFSYGVSGGQNVSYTWNGLLRHMEQVSVELPVPDAAYWMGDDDRLFTVAITAANGQPDDHAANDNYRTNFQLPVVYNHRVVLHYKTNNRPNETSVAVRDIQGNAVFSRNSHAANTQYIDTLDLNEGCYTFEMIDSGNDGLSYWADSGAGSGYCRLKKPNGVIVKNFEAEFGRTIHWPFTHTAVVGLEEHEVRAQLHAFPNPTTGTVTLEVTEVHGPARLEIIDGRGRIVHERNVELHGKDRLNVDLSDLMDGIYHVRVVGKDQLAMVRLMKM
ncbi:MAG: T9SS type A sorting domain-containing protein [Flavobacteriales bacterium]|nr:T9SS type A sorting domain-containing protein [Flavobacteriales bacterium]